VATAEVKEATADVKEATAEAKEVTAEAKEVTNDVTAEAKVVTAEVPTEVPTEAEADRDVQEGISLEGEKSSPLGHPPLVLHARDVEGRVMSQQHVPTPHIQT
jgi:hypothetical protein